MSTTDDLLQVMVRYVRNFTAGMKGDRFETELPKAVSCVVMAVWVEPEMMLVLHALEDQGYQPNKDTCWDDESMQRTILNMAKDVCIQYYNKHK